jgi:hypothetical protein
MEKPVECLQCGATAVDTCQMEAEKQDDCVRD